MDNNYYAGFNAYQPQTDEQPPKKRKMKTGVKVILFIVGAIGLGALAGVTCYGVNYLGHTLFPITINQNIYEQPPTGNSTITNIDPIAKDDIDVRVFDVSDVVGNVISSVVAINGTYTTNTGIWGGTYESEVSGSGIIIGVNETELLIVTNAHVVEDVDDTRITFYDGSEVAVNIKGKKSEYDLAVLSAKLSDIPNDAIYSIANIGDSNEIKVGQAAIAVGNSMGYGISVTTGCISALNKTVTVDSVSYKNLIQTDAAINPGNSGGALFNAQGEVIGINSVKMSNTNVEGMGYAISISSVMDIINEMSLEETREKLSDDERGYLGITGISITSGISESYGYPIGILVRSVTSGGAADRAGIVKNDVIKSFDGEIIDNYDELIDMMCYYPVGEEVDIVYYRLNSKGEYEEHQTKVVLTARPQ